MANTIFFVFILFSAFGSIPLYGSTNATKHYIVYMGEHSYPDSNSVIASNHEMLHSVIGSVEKAHKSVVNHYTKSFRGFSALLTPEQADQIAKLDEVVSVFESTVHRLHTTRSWNFLEDLSVGAVKGNFFRTQQRKDYDVIVGHFDSGVWPESQSFSPVGLGPVPERFRGECATGQRFTEENCNRKIIGARYYYKGYLHDVGDDFGFLSPRDDYGHGTHTASIAVGAEVNHVFLLGSTNSTVRGGAPTARLSIYKVCWNDYCTCSDVLNAFDDAIYDRVDLITMSLGGENGRSIMDDCFSIGSLHAFKNGILVSISGSNEGKSGAVLGVSPWAISSSATSIDREFDSWIRLGNQNNLKGHGKYSNSFGGNYYGLVTARSAAAYGIDLRQASLCKENTLNWEVTRGNIVICEMENLMDYGEDKSNVLYDVYAVGMILICPSDRDVAVNAIDGYSIPTVMLNLEESRNLESYLQTERYPIATFLAASQELRIKPAPQVAFFSSRGPNAIFPDIIKPDITAPGLNIIGAYPPPYNLPDNSLTYAIMYGTSMACPHVSGVAAIIKALHKDWSPAAIKSALMTTTSLLDNTGNWIQSGNTRATPFDLGSGLLNPDQALDPGLIYDFNINDVANFLCSNGLSRKHLRSLLQKKVRCIDPPVAPYNLNYPSIGIGKLDRPISVYRTLTFVGSENDPKIYRVSVEVPDGVELKVGPDYLDFSNSRNATFRIDITPLRRQLGYVFGSLTWSDGQNHNVRSPIALNLV